MKEMCVEEGGGGALEFKGSKVVMVLRIIAVTCTCSSSHEYVKCTFCKL